jgi:hypothetical protein
MGQILLVLAVIFVEKGEQRRLPGAYAERLHHKINVAAI